jgi:Uma2 family endonuclease
MPPCADYQQDVAVEVARVLGNWSVEHPEFIVGGNEAGMLLDGEVRAADVAVWRRADVGAHRGRFRTVAPVLAIEVAGQDEDESGLLEKAAWYLRHGVRSVWLAFPTTRVVLLVTPRKTHRVAGRRRLSAPGLPGLEPSAEALFRQLGA